jgi:hypothetical protein
MQHVRFDRSAIVAEDAGNTAHAVPTSSFLKRYGISTTLAKTLAHVASPLRP